MIRFAEFADIPEMVDIIRARYRTSPYAALGPMSTKNAKDLLKACIQRNHVTGDGGTCPLVTVGDDRKVEGFIIGMLEPVYHIGPALQATDLYATSRPGANPTDMPMLWRRIVQWAEMNPKVVELVFGFVDTFGGDLDRFDSLARRLDLTRCGAIYRRSIQR